MSKLRSVSTAFWSDPFIEDLSPSQKLLFLYLITNEKTNMLGIYEASIKKMSFETSINKDDIEKALKKFEAADKVKYLDNYVILINYMKHQNFNTNMKKSAIDTYNNLPNVLKDSKLDITKDKPLEGFESLLNHYGMVSKVEVEYEVKVEDESKYEEEVKKIVYSDEVHACFEVCLKSFPEQLHPKDKNGWLDTIDKLHRIDNVPYHMIEKITQGARADEFWAKHFLSLNKLRKTNKDDVKYIVVFNENQKSNGKQQTSQVELDRMVDEAFGQPK